jgi:hypothetical protein
MSFVVYRGPSNLDQKPIIGILTFGSKNTKTGPMAQLWILREDVAPHSAQKNGEDYSVCGDCALRPTNKDNRQQKYGCYVKTYQGPRSAWEHNKNKPVKLKDACKKLKGIPLRLGAYGDPAAIPEKVIKALTSASKTWTGYTHQHNHTWLQPYCMASVETTLDALRLQKLGWRTFRQGEVNSKNEITCPHITHSVQCIDCKLCDGSRNNDKRKNIVIPNHR